MNNDNGQNEATKKPLKSRVFEGIVPIILDPSNIIAAQKAIAKLPGRTLDPKALEVAKQFGLDFVPHV